MGLFLFLLFLKKLKFDFRQLLQTLHLLRRCAADAIICCSIGAGLHDFGSHFICASPPQLKRRY